MIKSIAFLSLAWAVTAQAQVPNPDSTIAKPLAAMRVIALRNGPNRIDFNGDGRIDEVFVGRRENFNAHDFSIFTFYASYPSSYMSGVNWHVVPFFSTGGENEKDALETSEGADCSLTNVWVVQDSSRHPAEVEVVVGQRGFGGNYGDRDTVQFTIYHLVRNTDGIPGSPQLSFEVGQTITTPKKYCDVGRAAVDALGLRLGRGQH